MLEQMGIAAKQASYKLAQLSSREKNRVLEKIADELEAQSEIILNANAQDVADARANGLSEAMLDRLALTPARLKGIADDVRQVCNLADPVGQVIDGGVLDDVDTFLVQARSAPESLLSRMTGGVHLHTLRCPDRASFERIRAELDRQGLLYRRE